jgi:hypothetical protein
MLALAAIAAGCRGELAPLCEDGSCGTQTSSRKTFQMTVNAKVDILFVVDDTNAMAPHLNLLAAGFADIGHRLQDMDPPLSLHAGFVRAGRCDMSMRGLACGVTPPEQFMRSEWCGSMPNFSSGFADLIACLADFGTADCGPAQPLSAAVQAVTGSPRPGWEGFLRPNAYLMILLVVATDDASGDPNLPTAVSDLVSRLKELKADPSQILVSVVGPADCATGDVPGPRLIELVTAFGANGLYAGLCGGDPLPAALQRLLSPPSFDRLQPPCLGNVRDIDLVTPGLQAECAVEHHSIGPDGSLANTPLPSCDQGAPPCWRLGPRVVCGGVGPGWIAEIVEPADWCFEGASNFTIECLGCADANDPACAVQP